MRADFDGGEVSLHIKVDCKILENSSLTFVLQDGFANDK